LFSIDTSTAAGDTSGRYKPQIQVFLPDGVTRVPIEQTPLPRALRGEKVSNVELILVEPDGKARATLGSARQLFGPDGECMGAVAVAQDITDRKEAELELERTHKQLLDASRFAGMAEVASNVLHNVGNVLTSVNVSANLVSECVRDAKVAGLGRAAAMLKEREKDLAVFLTTDERGRKLPAYLGQLAEHLQGNQKLALKELAALRDNIEHIKETVAMQQSYAKLCGVSEIVAVNALIEDSLRMNAAALTRHGVAVNREIDDAVPSISVDKHKVLQILVNLIRNAKYACDDTERQDKQITIRVNTVEARVRIAVIDNGVGISPENMSRLFRHGFTTRKTGHGFGLHSGALAAKELGGSLTAHSDGLGCGASFTLELPIVPAVEAAVGATRE
jgi:C4-dicarboxylate-specific signal transduction histidine kinase